MPTFIFYLTGKWRRSNLNNSQKIMLVGLKSDLAGLPRFKNRCYVCHAESHKKGMTFHHLWYEPDELTYQDFDTSLDYYCYLEEKIRNNPKRFLYLCNPHHQAVERMKRYGKKTFPRLLKAVKMSR